MNRRKFFSTLGKAAAGFSILPAATTQVFYGLDLNKLADQLYAIKRARGPERECIEFYLPP